MGEYGDRRYRGARGVIPPAPRVPDITYPEEERTPDLADNARNAAAARFLDDRPPSSGSLSGTAQGGAGVDVHLGGKRRVHVGTATIVAIIAALTAGGVGRATAGAAVDQDLREEFRDFRKEVREELKAVRADIRAIPRD
jgi:hypothetical protein